MDEHLSMALRVGGIYKILHEYCNYDYARWSEIVRSHPTLNSITRNILTRNHIPHIYTYHYVSSSIDDIKRLCDKSIEPVVKPMVKPMAEPIDEYADSDDPVNLPDVHLTHDYMYLYVFRWLIKTQYPITSELNRYKIFKWLCSYGFLTMAKIFHQLFHLRLSDHQYDDVFSSTFKNGHLHVVQWLVEAFPDVHRFFHDYLFEQACEAGHLHMAQWFTQKFPLNYVSLMINFEFEWACYNGHLHVAQWLVKKFHDIICRLNVKFAFKGACERGKLHVAKWIFKTFPHEVHHRVSDDHIFRQTCVNGYLNVAMWLVETFPDINHRASDDHAFWGSCQTGRRYVLQWLVRTFPEFLSRFHNDIEFRQKCMKNNNKLVF